MLTNGKLKDIQKITQYYFKAVSLYPYEGKYYMLLASIEILLILFL